MFTSLCTAGMATKAPQVWMCGFLINISKSVNSHTWNLHIVRVDCNALSIVHKSDIFSQSVICLITMFMVSFFIWKILF